ncbi:MAG TPA: trypsin-like peptidase domain-containing protein, partial [Bacteroidales bacterium]|nr:trypsin-like peptidase domain-containing protein [Bacteroidales bacterium]
MNLFVSRLVRVYICFAFVVCSITVNAQHPIVPKSDVVYTLPQIPIDTLQRIQTLFPNMFAYPFFVDINFISQSSSIVVNDTVYYTMHFASPGAYSLNIIFDSLYINEHGIIWLYNPSKTSVAGPFYKKNIHNHSFASPLIWGDTICITYCEPLTVNQNTRIFIRQISHDFKQDFEAKKQLKALADTCNVNINCGEGTTWYNEKRAVCKLIIGGTSICTGTLVNNTSHDATPYVLTANHCLSSQASAEKTVFYFNYEYQDCEGSGQLNNSYVISGSNLVATSPGGKIDFTLLQMVEIPPAAFNVYYAGWDASGTITKGSVCIHHPRGDAKKISIDNDSYSTASFLTYVKLSHWKISRWDKGTTESGSSGSALFSMNKQVIGTLSGGEANCSKPINDYFSKLSVAWDYHTNDNERLKPWLDPQNTGKTVCTGFDPNLHDTHVISNIKLTDSIGLYDFANKATGLWTGVNEIGWSQFADYIPFSFNKNIYAISLLGSIDTTQDMSHLIFKIWQGVNKPEQVLYSTPLHKSMVVDSVWIKIIPDEAIQTNGSFWVGYEIQDKCSAFTAFMAKPRSVENSLYIEHPKRWIPANLVGINSSLAVELYVTNQPDTISVIEIEKPIFAAKINHTIKSYSTVELFAVDSIPCLYDTTQYFLVSPDNGISTWNGPNNVSLQCISNVYSKNTAPYIQGITVGIHSVPQSNNVTRCMVWDKSNENIIYEKDIPNTELRATHKNQIYFDTPIPIGETFSAGLCFDLRDYDTNISVYSIHNSFTNSIGTMFIPYNWYS